jgi:hypothetical protein
MTDCVTWASNGSATASVRGVLCRLPADMAAEWAVLEQQDQELRDRRRELYGRAIQYATTGAETGLSATLPHEQHQDKQ